MCGCIIYCISVKWMFTNVLGFQENVFSSRYLCLFQQRQKVSCSFREETKNAKRNHVSRAPKNAIILYIYIYVYVYNICIEMQL